MHGRCSADALRWCTRPLPHVHTACAARACLVAPFRDAVCGVCSLLAAGVCRRGSTMPVCAPGVPFGAFRTLTNRLPAAHWEGGGSCVGPACLGTALPVHNGRALLCDGVLRRIGGGGVCLVLGLRDGGGGGGGGLGGYEGRGWGGMRAKQRLGTSIGPLILGALFKISFSPRGTAFWVWVETQRGRLWTA